MAIDLKSIDLAGTAASSTRKANTTSTPAVPSRAAEADATQQSGSEVNVSSTATLLSRLQSALASQPAVDHKRVDAISKAINNGTYHVNSSSIAHGLVDSERALSKLKV